MVMISQCHKQHTYWHTWELCNSDPVLAILFLDFSRSHPTLSMAAMEYTSHVILCKLRDFDETLTPWSDFSSFDAAFDTMMDSEALRSFRQRFRRDENIGDACVDRFVVSVSLTIQDDFLLLSVLEGFLHWILRQRNPTNVIHLVTNMLHHRLAQIIECNHSVLHWFYLLWSELSKHRTYSLHGSLSMSICVKTVVFLSAIDRYPVPSTSSRAFNAVCGRSWSPSTRCSSLCRFHNVILQFIEKIKVQNPGIALTGQTWRDLVWSLNEVDQWHVTRETSHPSQGQSHEWSWSTQEHRARIKQDIIEAFKTMTLPDSQGMFSHFSCIQHSHRLNPDLLQMIQRLVPKKIVPPQTRESRL